MTRQRCTGRTGSNEDSRCASTTGDSASALPSPDRAAVKTRSGLHEPTPPSIVAAINEDAAAIDEAFGAYREQRSEEMRERREAKQESAAPTSVASWEAGWERYGKERDEARVVESVIAWTHSPEPMVIVGGEMRRLAEIAPYLRPEVVEDLATARATPTLLAHEMPDPRAMVTGPLSLAFLPGLDAAPRGRKAPHPLLRQRDLGQYFTPPWLADVVARLARVRGRVVLEPSAGSGNIVAACLAAGAAKVIACEIDPAMCARLRERFINEPVQVIEGDFLSLPAALFDNVEAIAGNPPYDGGMDSDHLAKIADIVERHERLDAPVEPALLLRTVALHSQERYERVWSRLSVRELIACPDRIAFEIDGRTGEAGKIDVSVMRIGWRLPNDRDAIGFVREPAAGPVFGAVGT
jgi:hypothetical protein